MKNALKTYFILSALLIPLNGYAKVYNVIDYGAKGDKRNKDTQAIQAAIEACSKAGGGIVYIPAGDYLSGTIRLLSNVNLHLELGATIWSSRVKEDYNQRCLIYAQNGENISIDGDGSFYGIGERLKISTIKTQ